MKPSAITSLSSTFFVIIFSGFILPELIAWRTSSKSPRTYVATPYLQISHVGRQFGLCTDLVRLLSEDKLVRNDPCIFLPDIQLA